MFQAIYSGEEGLSTSDYSPSESATAARLTEADVVKSLMNIAKRVDEAETYLAASTSYISASRRALLEMKYYACVAEIDVSSAEECTNQLENKLQAMRLELQPLLHNTFYQHAGNQEYSAESEQSLNISMENSSVPEHVLKTIEKYANDISLDVNSCNVVYEEYEGSTFVVIHPVDTHNISQKLCDSAKTPQQSKRKNDSEPQSKFESASNRVSREQNTLKTKPKSMGTKTYDIKLGLQKVVDVNEGYQNEILNRQCMAFDKHVKCNVSSSSSNRKDSKSTETISSKHQTEKADLSPNDVNKYSFKKSESRSFPSISESTSDLSFTYRKAEKKDGSISDMPQELKMRREYDWIRETTKMAGSLAENRPQLSEARFSCEHGAFGEVCSSQNRRLISQPNISENKAMPNKTCLNLKEMKLEKKNMNKLSRKQRRILEHEIRVDGKHSKFSGIAALERTTLSDTQSREQPSELENKVPYHDASLTISDVAPEELSNRSKNQEQKSKDEAISNEIGLMFSEIKLMDMNPSKQSNTEQMELKDEINSKFGETAAIEEIALKQQSSLQTSGLKEMHNNIYTMIRDNTPLKKIDSIKRQSNPTASKDKALHDDAVWSCGQDENLEKTDFKISSTNPKNRCDHEEILPVRRPDEQSSFWPRTKTDVSKKELGKNWSIHQVDHVDHTIPKNENKGDFGENASVSSPCLALNREIKLGESWNDRMKTPKTVKFFKNLKKARKTTDFNASQLVKSQMTTETGKITPPPVRAHHSRDAVSSEELKTDRCEASKFPSTLKVNQNTHETHPDHMAKHEKDIGNVKNFSEDKTIIERNACAAKTNSTPCLKMDTLSPNTSRAYSSEPYNWKRNLLQRSKKKAFSRKSIISQIDDSSFFEDYKTSNDMVHEINDVVSTPSRSSNYTLRCTKEEIYRYISDNPRDGNFNRLQKDSSTSTSPISISSRKSKNLSPYVSYKKPSEVDDHESQILGEISDSNSSTHSATLDNFPRCNQVEYLDTSNKLEVDYASEVETTDFKCTRFYPPSVESEKFRAVIPNVNSDLAQSASFHSSRDSSEPFYIPSASKSYHHSLRAKTDFDSSLTNRQPTVVNTCQNINSAVCGDSVPRSISVDNYASSFDSPIRSSSTPIFEIRGLSDSDS